MVAHAKYALWTDDRLWPQILSGSPICNGHGVRAEFDDVIHEDREASLREWTRQRDLHLPVRGLRIEDWRRRS